MPTEHYPCTTGIWKFYGKMVASNYRDFITNAIPLRTKEKVKKLCILHMWMWSIGTFYFLRITDIYLVASFAYHSVSLSA